MLTDWIHWFSEWWLVLAESEVLLTPDCGWDRRSWFVWSYLLRCFLPSTSRWRPFDTFHRRNLCPSYNSWSSCKSFHQLSNSTWYRSSGRKWSSLPPCLPRSSSSISASSCWAECAHQQHLPQLLWVFWGLIVTCSFRWWAWRQHRIQDTWLMSLMSPSSILSLHH